MNLEIRYICAANSSIHLCNRMLYTMAYIKMIMEEDEVSAIDSEIQKVCRVQANKTRAFINETKQVENILQIIHQALASGEEDTAIMKKRDLRKVAATMNITLEKMITIQAASSDDYKNFMKITEMEVDQI